MHPEWPATSSSSSARAKAAIPSSSFLSLFFFLNVRRQTRFALKMKPGTLALVAASAALLFTGWMFNRPTAEPAASPRAHTDAEAIWDTQLADPGFDLQFDSSESLPPPPPPPPASPPALRVPPAVSQHRVAGAAGGNLTLDFGRATCPGAVGACSGSSSGSGTYPPTRACTQRTRAHSSRRRQRARHRARAARHAAPMTTTPRRRPQGTATSRRNRGGSRRSPPAPPRKGAERHATARGPARDSTATSAMAAATLGRRRAPASVTCRNVAASSSSPRSSTWCAQAGGVSCSRTRVQHRCST